MMWITEIFLSNFYILLTYLTHHRREQPYPVYVDSLCAEPFSIPFLHKRTRATKRQHVAVMSAKQDVTIPT